MTEEYPSDAAGLHLQQREVVPIEGNAKIDNDYVQYVHATMRCWGISCFTMDWEKHWDDFFNHIMCQFFIQVWKWDLSTSCFGLLAQCDANSINFDNHLLMAIYWRHSKSLHHHFKCSKKGGQALFLYQEKILNKSVACQLYLQEQGVKRQYVEPFDKRYINSDDEVTMKDKIVIALAKTPTWRLDKASSYIDWIESRRRSQRISTTPSVRKRPNVPIYNDNARIPIGLPQDLYYPLFLDQQSSAKQKALQMTPTLFKMVDDFNLILPQTHASFTKYPPKAHIDLVDP
ncbi:hypothetical protein PCANC_23299 [Puccinia coronata f. sp. avenae]|uniref:Uncharacterized protein n=1 Tax=Puccinia coronata f. sp. avenae TaxID=200324 RepID=A0A2N5TJC8_9BASI|nr:hypothetical protein PCANC_23299 [Puccinia coronata f. sp. avenae]